MRKILPIVIVAVVYFLAGACDFVNPEEDTPAFIRIEEIAVEEEEIFGTNSSKIVDAWVYINDNPLGTFELPVTIPALHEGENKITILPGIMLNGISNTRSVYPFYEKIEGTIELTTGETNKNYAAITTRYKDNITLPMQIQEDFESAGVKFEKYGDSDTMFYKINDPSIIDQQYGGDFAGAIYLTEEHNLFEVATNEYYSLPKDQSPVFLEFDYKNNQIFSVGFIANNYVHPYEVLSINKKDQWNKIYLNLTSPIKKFIYANKFKIYIRAQKDPELEKANIYLDNIKLIY